MNIKSFFSLLLSGSDDQRLNLWSPLSGGGKLKRSIRTLHTGNIFSAKVRNSVIFPSD